MRSLPVVAAALLLATLAACGDVERPDAALADDREIAALVLKDFAGWDGATFGKQPGVLRVAPESPAQPNLTAAQVQQLAPNIQDRMTQELAGAFVLRNRKPTPVAAMLAGTRWAEIGPAGEPGDPTDLPAGIKAVGRLSLPGIGADGTSAVIQIQHSWSIHGAIVTYVLAKEQGAWQIVARDQVVFP